MVPAPNPGNAALERLGQTTPGTGSLRGFGARRRAGDLGLEA